MLTPGLAKRFAALLYFCGALFLGAPLSTLMQTVLRGTGPVLTLKAAIASQLAICGWLPMCVLLFKQPVAVTQFLVVGTVVAAVVLGQAVEWFPVQFLGLVWACAPLFAMLVSRLCSRALDRWVWSQEDPLAVVLHGLPYGLAGLVGVFSFTVLAFPLLQYWVPVPIPVWAVLLVALAAAAAIGAATYYFSYYFAVPSIKEWVFAQFQEAWQEYFPLGDDTARAARASMEQKGVYVEAGRDLEQPAGSRRASGLAKSSAELSRIRAEEAFGYPQLLALSFLLLVDGGLIASVVTGPLRAVAVFPESGLMTSLAWTLLGALPLAIGVLALSRFSLEWTATRYYAQLSVPAAFSMELGALLPALFGLAMGAPISLGQAKLLAVFAWLLCGRPSTAADRALVLWTVLAWVGGLLAAAGLPALFALGLSFIP